MLTQMLPPAESQQPPRGDNISGTAACIGHIFVCEQVQGVSAGFLPAGPGFSLTCISPQPPVM